MNLSECPLRARAQIVRMEAAPQFRLRLEELGVRPGVSFTAVNRAAFGGMVVNIGGARVAVDHRSAQLMEVVLTQ